MSWRGNRKRSVMVGICRYVLFYLAEAAEGVAVKTAQSEGNERGGDGTKEGDGKKKRREDDQ